MSQPVALALFVLASLCLGITTATTPSMAGVIAACRSEVHNGQIAGCAVTQAPSALAECLQSHLGELSPTCVNTVTQVLRDSGIDQEVVDQETSESDGQIEAEDEICNARLSAVCRNQLYFAAATGNTTALQACARSHTTTIGQACAAIVQNAASDGLLRHIRRCWVRSITMCPAEATLLAGQLALGYDNIKTAAPLVAPFMQCLRSHAASMRQGCQGMADGLAKVLQDLSSKASDQFNQEDNPGTPSTPTKPDDPTKPETPTNPGTPSKPGSPSGQTSTGSETEDDSKSSGLSAGAKAGIGISVTVACLAAAGVGVFLWRRHRRVANLSSMMGLASSQGEGPSQLEVGFTRTISGKASAYERLDSSEMA